MYKVAKLQARIKPTALCLAIDKENSIESPLDLLHYIYNYYCGYVSCLPQSSCPSANFFVICYDSVWCDHFCDYCHTFVTLWWSHDTFSMLHPSNKEKKRKEKEKLNNDLAVLPSHDMMEF